MKETDLNETMGNHTHIHETEPKEKDEHHDEVGDHTHENDPNEPVGVGNQAHENERKEALVKVADDNCGGIDISVVTWSL